MMMIIFATIGALSQLQLPRPLACGRYGYTLALYAQCRSDSGPAKPARPNESRDD